MEKPFQKKFHILLLRLSAFSLIDATSWKKPFVFIESSLRSQHMHIHTHVFVFVFLFVFTLAFAFTFAYTCSGRGRGIHACIMSATEQSRSILYGRRCHNYYNHNQRIQGCRGKGVRLRGQQRLLSGLRLLICCIKTATAITVQVSRIYTKMFFFLILLFFYQNLCALSICGRAKGGATPPKPTTPPLSTLFSLAARDN